MAKKEAHTDLWVYELLKEANLEFDAQGSTIKEVEKALKSASKAGTGNVGRPEYCGVVKDFLIVIEDKAKLEFHIKRNEDDLICEDQKNVRNYAVNGALFYGKHLAEKTSYKKILAIGVSGNEKKHRISPVFVDERKGYKELPELETFISFSESNIDEYYIREILKEETDREKETSEILRDASILHEDLRNYGSTQDKDKPLIVSGILLALKEIEFGNFSIDNLTGDTISTDGSKIYKAIEAHLQRANVSPQVKKDKLLSQFLVIRDTEKINSTNETLKKTPLKHYTEFLYKSIYQSIRYHQSAEDYLGRFYGEFMSYSGGDGQSLGIVLTPKHITELFCDLLELNPEDKVFDPCCGTAGFLVAAMNSMVTQANTEEEKRSIRKDQLFGMEDQSYMFTIATTNMILRGDGKSNLEIGDFLKQNPAQLQLKGCTKGMMNPPYSQGSKQNPDLYEIAFIEHLLKSIIKGGKVAVIVPQSSFTGKTKEEVNIKRNILKYHTLEGVITLNKNTFYGVGTNPCIAIFTTGEPHPKGKICKFINFEDDGFVVSKHMGLIESTHAKDKKQHLLDVWFDRLGMETRFCVKTTIEADDEWLHSFYYFNDEIPTEADFEKTIVDYLTFEVNMITQDRDHLLDSDNSNNRKIEVNEEINVANVEWQEFFIKDILDTIQRGKRLTKENQIRGEIPYISSTSINNGIDNFIGNSEGVRKFSNCLTIANSGSVGATFFHPYVFIASDHVTALAGKNINRYVYFFLGTVIERLGEKYSFNREMNARRITREKILLPISSCGNPDWQLMENYMKALEKNQIQKIIRYFENKLDKL